MTGKVRIKHNSEFDRQYQLVQRVVREAYNGLTGIIVGDSNSHGECYEVATERGNAWYEPSELELV